MGKPLQLMRYSYRLTVYFTKRGKKNQAALNSKGNLEKEKAWIAIV
jgi:hypothetical protein